MDFRRRRPRLTAELFRRFPVGPAPRPGPFASPSSLGRTMGIDLTIRSSFFWEQKSGIIKIDYAAVPPLYRKTPRSSSRPSNWRIYWAASGFRAMLTARLTALSRDIHPA